MLPDRQQHVKRQIPPQIPPQIPARCDPDVTHSGCAPQNRRTHHAPNFSLSLSLKTLPLRFLAHLPRLRCLVWVPDRPERKSKRRHRHGTGTAWEAKAE